MIKSDMSYDPFNQTNWSEAEWNKKDMLLSNLEKHTRLKTPTNNIIDPSILDPLTLDPQTATMDDIAIHAKTEQYLSDKTIAKRLRYLRYMETHDYPIDLRDPTEKEFIRHIRYRMYHETPTATINALKHEKLAFNMLRKCYGLPEITIKFPRQQPNKKMIIPLPEIVRELWHYKYDKQRPIRKLYQYMFRLSFLIGMRPPSEIANLKTSDILFNRNGTAILTLHEDKENGRQRTIILPPAIATDPRHKSLQNWLTSWRPRIANENCDALFPKKNGDYWTAAHLGKEMRTQGKKVWEPYHPYVSRHWSCIARLIEQKELHDHWNTLVVKEWHGHDKIKNTEKYIKYARQYYAIAEYNWIQRVLKAPWCEDSTLKPTNTRKTLVSGRTPPVGEYGRGHTHTDFSLEKNREILKKLFCWDFQPLLSFHFSKTQSRDPGCNILLFNHFAHDNPSHTKKMYVSWVSNLLSDSHNTLGGTDISASAFFNRQSLLSSNVYGNESIITRLANTKGLQLISANIFFDSFRTQGFVNLTSPIYNGNNQNNIQEKNNIIDQGHGTSGFHSPPTSSDTILLYDLDCCSDITNKMMDWDHLQNKPCIGSSSFIIDPSSSLFPPFIGIGGAA